MFSHIAKLIWNRKRSNVLIITEIVITFIVLFAIISATLHNYRLFNLPLGFNWENTWAIELNTGSRWNNETDKNQLKAIVEVLKQRPEIASVGLIRMGVFVNAHWRSSRPINGRESIYHSNMVDQDALKNWGVELVAGRWFGEQDNGQSYTEIVVNQLFVDEYLPDQDPVNFEFGDPEQPQILPMRIVGVFKDFRQQGEFSVPGPYMFTRYQIEEGHTYGVREINIKFKEPKTAAYEATLLKLLKSIAPNWEFNINSWEKRREQQIQNVVLPLGLAAVVVIFLLIMVAMGLFGVLWQNISRRTQEIGLRRAIGASERSIRLQIIGEILVLALFGISIAFIFLIQVPLLQLIELVSWSNFWFSLLASVSTILLIVILCALYPSRTAIKMSPAVALHYE